MSKQKKYLKCSRKYDIPLFCAGWTGPIASSEIGSDASPAGPLPDHPDGEQPSAEAGAFGHVVIGGGGGDKKNGVRNLIVLARYDFGTDELSEAVCGCSID
jgi:hypothetical protein